MTTTAPPHRCVVRAAKRIHERGEAAGLHPGINSHDRSVPMLAGTDVLGPELAAVSFALAQDLLDGALSHVANANLDPGDQLDAMLEVLAGFWQHAFLAGVDAGLEDLDKHNDGEEPAA